MVSVGQLVYERRAIQADITNHQLQLKANHALFDHYHHLKLANISITAYNKDLVVTGQVPKVEDKQLVSKILQKIKGARRVFNELTIGANVGLAQSMKDSWITSKIRARMIAANDINPRAFKIITEMGVVYILGDVKKAQARIVVDIARNTTGVKKVIRILKYYQFV